MMNFKLNISQTYTFYFLSIGLFLLIISPVLLSDGKIGRNKSQIEDTYTIIAQIPEHTTINILPSMWEDYSLHGYYSRYKNISLEMDKNPKRVFLLID